MEKMIYIAWSQWHGHNQRIFESQLVHPHAAVHSPSCLFLDYKRLVRELPGSSICRKVWLAPKPGELKLNINGAIFPYQKHAGTGCVLQDERPGLCSYGCNNKRGMARRSFKKLSTFLAIFRRLQFCLPLSLSSLVVEGD